MSTPIEKVGEPVRKWIYGILAAVAAVLVFYGVFTEESVIVWTAVLQAVLVVPFVETARAKVSPVKGTQNAQNNGSNSA